MGPARLPIERDQYMSKRTEWEVLDEETPIIRFAADGNYPEAKATVVLQCPNGHLVAFISNPGLYRNVSDWPCSGCGTVAVPVVWPTPSEWRA